MTSPLAEALVAFQSELPSVGKGKTATVPTKTGGSYSYTYADLGSVSAAAIPLLVKHGLAFHTAPRLVEGGAYELVGILRHSGGETVEGALPLFGRTPQELGSAMTYARRYLLGCMTGIVTEDDDDGARAQSSQGQTRRQEPPPTPEQLLSNARALAWSAFLAHNPAAKADDFVAAYEQACAQPFIEAGVADFERFTAYVEGAQA